MGGGLWWPRVTRGYIVSRLTVVSRGLLGGADTPGKGDGGLGVHSHTNSECRFTVGEKPVMGGGGGTEGD